MPDWRKILRSAPFGMIVLATGAAALYIALLVNAGAPPADGEAAFSQAWSGFLLTLMLWIALALLLVVGAVMGRMPASAAIIEFFLHPISGVAAFVVLDVASSRRRLAPPRPAAAADRQLRFLGAIDVFAQSLSAPPRQLRRGRRDRVPLGLRLCDRPLEEYSRPSKKRSYRAAGGLWRPRPSR